MATYNLMINGKSHKVDVDPQMPLLWVIRDFVGLKGTKFGCGIAQCGACTVHYDGNPIKSCSFPVSAAAGHKITTIEGIADRGMWACHCTGISSGSPFAHKMAS